MSSQPSKRSKWDAGPPVSSASTPAPNLLQHVPPQFLAHPAAAAPAQPVAAPLASAQAPGDVFKLAQEKAAEIAAKLGVCVRPARSRCGLDDSSAFPLIPRSMASSTSSNIFATTLTL